MNTRWFGNSFNIIQTMLNLIKMMTRIEFTILVSLLIFLFLINIIGLLDPVLFVANLMCLLFLLGFGVYLMIKPELSRVREK